MRNDNDRAKRLAPAPVDRRLPELVTRASEGEQIVIAQDEHPLAKLVPFSDVKGERTFGQARGRIHVSEDFDEPLADDFWLGRPK